jgi:AraC-like DNA-binding protein
VPRKQLFPLVASLDERAIRLIPSATGSLKLLTGYLRAILSDEALTSPEMSRVVVSHLHDLIALSIDATRDHAVTADSRGVRAARLQAIKADIAANLAEGSLTIADIAGRQGVTPRYVHKLFESEGMTYTQFVLGQRLERAYRMLRDGRFGTRSITSIAYDVGFGDLSYFNRAFRRRYNATPSDIRNSCV